MRTEIISSSKRKSFFVVCSFILSTACLLQSAVAYKIRRGDFPKLGRSLIGTESASNAVSLMNSRAASASSRFVSLPLGEVRGIACSHDASVTQYLGIPFAEPVLRASRFTPPLMHSTPYPYPALNATKPGATCGDICDPAGSFEDRDAEDCLFLNIYVPPGASANSAVKRPVQVFIYGGNILMCAASDIYWNGCNAAAKTGVIHVNIQARGGPFGFLSHPLLMEESNTTGNWALLDQQLALRWVKENIGYFGGDPSKILLNGQSRGAQQIDFHMISPGAAGLFSAAILMSPSCVVLRTLEQSYSDSQRYMEGCGCAPLESAEAELECMRTKPYRELRAAAEVLESLNAPESFWCDSAKWQPTLTHTIDGTTIPQALVEAYEQGNFHKVPYLTGITTAEAGQLVEDWYPLGVTSEDTLQFIEYMYPGANQEAILALYPLEHYEGAPNPNNSRLMSLWTDSMWSCPLQRRLTARMKGLVGTSVPTFLYYWGTTPSCPPEDMFKGAYHGTSLWFAFGNTDEIYCSSCHSGFCSLNQAEKELSDRLVAAHASMAETGVPRWQNGTAWAEWDVEAELGTYFNTNLEMTLPISFVQKCSALQEAQQLVRS